MPRWWYRRRLPPTPFGSAIRRAVVVLSAFRTPLLQTAGYLHDAGYTAVGLALTPSPVLQRVRLVVARITVVRSTPPTLRCAFASYSFLGWIALSYTAYSRHTGRTVCGAAACCYNQLAQRRRSCWAIIFFFKTYATWCCVASIRYLQTITRLLLPFCFFLLHYRRAFASSA